VTVPIVALMSPDDLFFVARVQAAAKELGVSIVVSAPGHGLEICNVEKPRLVIVDLRAKGAISAVEELRAGHATRSTRIVGFYPHVETALRDAATAAGADEVLPQSAFTVRLGALLASAATG